MEIHPLLICTPWGHSSKYPGKILMCLVVDGLDWTTSLTVALYKLRPCKFVDFLYNIYTRRWLKNTLSSHIFYRLCKPCLHIEKFRADRSYIWDKVVGPSPEWAAATWTQDFLESCTLCYKEWLVIGIQSLNMPLWWTGLIFVFRSYLLSFEAKVVPPLTYIYASAFH